MVALKSDFAFSIAFLAALIPLEYCPSVASLNASAQPCRCARLRTGTPMASTALVLAAGFGVGLLCLSTLSASSINWDCNWSSTFLGWRPPLSLAFFTIAFSVVSPSSPKMWQLVRTKLASGLVSKLPPLRRAFLTCSSAASLVFFTTVLDMPDMVLSAD
jgi:hypothetical protein